jgi:hypothetical protein
MAVLAAAPVAWCTLMAPGAVAIAQSDLDEFMRRVVTRRDDNWTKLQQYILDESESLDALGPGGVRVWGERRDYTWYVRDGFFVRSPLKVNGATVGEGDRRKYEADFLRREQRREQRANAGDPGSPSADALVAATDPPADDPARIEQDAPATDLDGLIRRTSQPEFIRAAYFLRFKFDQGRYALVGREMLDGREVLRVEYYPTRLFEDDPSDPERRSRRSSSRSNEAFAREIWKVLNKTSLITLWVDPTSEQILKYVFDNVAMDFHPGQWLAQVNEARATMTMGQPFPDVWLPRALEMQFNMTMAVGRFDLRYGLEYHDYRKADVTSKITVPDVR